MTELFEECLVAQKNAGFHREDRRTADCPQCGAHGYNTGWGYWAFECGAEVLTSGEVDAPCKRATR